MDKAMLDIYTDYLISQNHHATATGLSALLDGEVSHDKVTRFLHADDYGSKQLWQYVKPSVRQHEQPDGGVLILDDTISEKTYTDENDVNCWHYAHDKGRHIKGINILSCLVNYGSTSFPIAYEVIKKEVLYSDIKTKKLKRKSTITKNELLRELVSQAVSNDVLFAYVLADTWFGAKDNMEFVHDTLGKYFIFGVKSNRTVALSEADKQNGQFQQVQSLSLEDGQSLTVWLKGIDFPVQLLKKVFSNKDGSTGVLYLVSNDVSLDATHLYELYQKRWQIEVYHKSIKNNASLAKSPTKRVRSQRNHIFAALVAFCKLETLKLKSALNHFAIKHKLILRANQVAFKELSNMMAS